MKPRPKCQPYYDITVGGSDEEGPDGNLRVLHEPDDGGEGEYGSGKGEAQREEEIAEDDKEEEEDEGDEEGSEEEEWQGEAEEGGEAGANTWAGDGAEGDRPGSKTQDQKSRSGGETEAKREVGGYVDGTR